MYDPVAKQKQPMPLIMLHRGVPIPIEFALDIEGIEITGPMDVDLILETIALHRVKYLPSQIPDKPFTVATATGHQSGSNRLE